MPVSVLPSKGMVKGADLESATSFRYGDPMQRHHLSLLKVSCGLSFAESLGKPQLSSWRSLSCCSAPWDKLGDADFCLSHTGSVLVLCSHCLCHCMSVSNVVGSV